MKGQVGEATPKWWKSDAWAPGTVLREHVSPDPVFQMTTGWYFCEETWTECYGPFDDEELCREHLDKYVHFLEHGPSDQTSE